RRVAGRLLLRRLRPRALERRLPSLGLLPVLLGGSGRGPGADLAGLATRGRGTALDLERRQRLLIELAGGLEALGLLELTNRRLGLRPPHAVDRPHLVAFLLELFLDLAHHLPVLHALTLGFGSALLTHRPALHGAAFLAHHAGLPAALIHGTGLGRTLLLEGAGLIRALLVDRAGRLAGALLLRGAGRLLRVLARHAGLLLRDGQGRERARGGAGDDPMFPFHLTTSFVDCGCLSMRVERFESQTFANRRDSRDPVDIRVVCPRRRTRPGKLNAPIGFEADTSTSRPNTPTSCAGECTSCCPTSSGRGASTRNCCWRASRPGTCISWRKKARTSASSRK